jgi:F-type H+-transporting ATPase subunit gamma
MSSLREMRLRIRSVQNIAQVTRALQTVSASKVRKAQAAVLATRPYAAKAYEVLGHLANRRNLIRHPMLTPRNPPRNILAILISGDRGLAGAYNAGVVRAAFLRFQDSPAPVHYVVVGRKGREMLAHSGAHVTAEFTGLPPTPGYADVSPIGRIALDEFRSGKADEVWIVFTKFENLMRQQTVVQALLPIPQPESPARPAENNGPDPVYLFEPSQIHLLDQVIDRLVNMEVYEAILESLASEHAARMVTMRNATENANELTDGLRLDYNKARQQSITSDLLDIATGTEALTARTEKPT